MAGPTRDSRSPRQALIAGIALSLAAAGAAAFVALSPAGKAPDIARGAAVYAAHCAGCHGAKLEGQPDWRHVNATGRLPAPPLNGAGHAWRHSNGELLHIVKFSVLDQAGAGYRTDMPAFDGTLPDRDIAAVLAYIHGTWPSGIQAAQAFLNPDHAGMPAKIDGDWTLPPDCEEPARGKPAQAETPP